MNNAVKIEAKLVGSEKAKKRRTELAAELDRAFAARGPQAITDEIILCMDALVDAFADQLRELKKLL